MSVIANAVGISGILIGVFVLLAAKSLLRGLQWAAGIIVMAMISSDFFNRFPDAADTLLKSLF